MARLNQFHFYFQTPESRRQDKEMHMHSTRIICDISRASDGRVVSPKYLRDLVFPSVMLPISRRFAKKEHQESSDILAFSRSRRMHHVLDRD